MSALPGRPPEEPAAALPGRAELAGLPQRVVHPGSPTKSRVAVVQWQGRALLVKDVQPMHPVVRVLYGRRVLRREERALHALADCPGVPRLVGRIDGDALATEYVAADPLHRRLDPVRLRRALQRFGARVAGMHARGVAHLDLRQKRNVLVDAEGEVHLVDFQSAWVAGVHGARGWWWRRLVALDRSAVLKFKQRYAPDLLDATELAAAERARRMARLWIFNKLGPALRWLLRRRRARSP